MPGSTVGANSVEVQEFSCVISRVACRYLNDDKEEKRAVLYVRKEQQRSTSVNANMTSSSGTAVQGSITNQPDYEFYFITNHQGKEIEVRCKREANNCTNDKHKKYDIDYVDINSRELKNETRDINNGRLKLYYYNIFNHTAEFAAAATKAVIKKGMESDSAATALMSVPAGLAAGAIGGVAGDAVDLICSLRFIHLPHIDPGDKDDECHTSLTYRECPHRNGIQMITINTYPDITFSLEIGILGWSRKYNQTKKKTNPNTNKTTTTRYDKTTEQSFSVEFKVKFADITHKLTFEDVEEKELKGKARKGATIYKAIRSVADFFTKASNFAENLKKFLDPVTAADVGAVGNALGTTGKILSKHDKWLSGSLSIQPSLSGEWHYSVNDELTKLGRYIKLELGAECKGELIIDLIKLASFVIKKSKKTRTAVVATASVASGGLAAIPAVLINLLIDEVVTWLIDKFKEGIKFNLIFSGKVDLKSLTLEWDTSKTQVFSAKGLNLEIKPEIKLELALEFKTSTTFIVKINGEAKAYAEVASSLTWKLTLDVIKDTIGLSQNITINPFKIEIGYKVVGSYEVWKFSNETSKEGKLFEYESKPIEFTPDRKVLFDFSDEKKAKKGEKSASGGGGGGGRSWNSGNGSKVGGSGSSGGGGGRSW